MPKVAPIDQRKLDHIKINLEKDVSSGLSNGLERYRFIHEALPELDLEEINTTQVVFQKTLNAPVIISSMTGGTEEAKTINMRLAEAAQETGVAMGVGSQRASLEHSSSSDSFTICRKVAPEILLFANLGAVQLNFGFDIDDCRRAVDMINANALILHLNPLQEALQEGGNTKFTGIAKKIEGICTKLEVPIIVKEVGWGISERTAKILMDSGVSAIDVAGAGGTSWSQVEMHRATDNFTREMASTFVNWGIPTAESIINVKKAAPKMMIFASGGIRDGLEIAKCIALGATLGGMAGPFLKAAAVSSKKVVELIHLLEKQIRVTMFAVGAGEIRHLGNARLKEI